MQAQPSLGGFNVVANDASLVRGQTIENQAHRSLANIPYMDAPSLPSTFFGSGPQEEIAPIHSASLIGAWPRALMEYAGRRLTNKSDF